MGKLYRLSLVAALFFLGNNIFAQTITIGTITSSILCTGGTVIVPFTSTGMFNSGNVYTAQLSNELGTFYTPVNIGTVTSTANSDTIIATIPANTTPYDVYTIRVISSSPAVTGASNGYGLTIESSVIDSVSINVLPGNVGCQGTTFTFYAIPSNGGDSPAYQWILNGTNVGSSVSSFSSTSLNNGDQVYCVMTSDAACVSGSPATSDTITLSITPVTSPSVQIVPSTSNAFCPETSVKFQAQETNGGHYPSYQWEVNGVSEGSDSASFTTSLLQNGDTVVCVMSSSLACSLNNPATSSPYIANVYNTPNVTLQVSNPYCGEDNGSLAATVSGGYGLYSYLWNNGATEADLNNLAPAQYSLIVTDNNSGCTTSTGDLLVKGNILYSNINSPSIPCSAAYGNISVNVTDGTPPFRYTWSNGATTDTLKVHADSTYNVTITDAGGCTGVNGIIPRNSNGLIVTVTASPDTIFCGTTTANIKLGVSFYGDSSTMFSYKWSNGDTASTPLLGAGTYSVTVTDLNTMCTGTSTVTIYCAAGYGINVTTFADDNGNCRLDSNEYYVFNTKLELYKGGNLVNQYYIGANGTIMLDSGTYTAVVDTTGLPFMMSCPAGGDTTFTLSSANPFQNVIIGLRCKPGFDDGVWSINKSSFLFPGDTAIVSVLAGNIDMIYGSNCGGTAGDSGTLRIIFSGPVNYAGIAYGAPGGIAPSYVGHDTLLFNVFYFDHEDIFSFALAAQPGAQTGQQVCIEAAIIPNSAGDRDTSNNHLEQCYTISNSFDPNRKEINPDSSSLPTYYNGWLTYTIHYQNTGSAAAQNIIIQDTLDTFLEPETFQLTGYNPQAPQININGRYVTFNLANINLPDSTSNPVASQGYVQYRIKISLGIPGNTLVKNTASIYFDYNTPIRTNTVATLFFLTGINELQVGDGKLEVVPNPTEGRFEIKYQISNIPVGSPSGKYQIEKVEVYNVLGEKIIDQIITYDPRPTTFDLTSKPSGIYIVRVYDANGNVSTGKVVKE